MSQQQSNFGTQLHQAFAKKLNFKTILALCIFGMIIIVFVFSGLMGRGGQLGMGVAATVNGDIISFKQFQDQENRVTSYYSQMLGGQFENLIQKKHLQAEALNQLVDNSVAAQSAQNEMIFATDADIRLAIQDMPYFKKDGVFQSDLYKDILASNGLTPGDFEKTLRQQIAIQKMRGLFEASTVLTGLEKNVDAELKQSKLNLYYLKISPELFNSPQQITDAAVQTQLAQADFKARTTEYIKTHPKDSEVLAGRILLAQDKALKMAQEVEAELAKNPGKAAVESFLNQKNLKLKETGSFEMSTEVVPALNSPGVFKAALELTKEKPVAKNLVKEGDIQYLIILKDRTKDATADIKTDLKRNEMLDKQKSYSQYQYWLENSKKVFTINRNTELIQQ